MWCLLPKEEKKLFDLMGNEHDAFIFVLYRVGLWDFLDHFFNMVVLYLGILILHLKCKCKSWT